MAILREVNSSMGLMVEQINGDLRVHRHAPSKKPTLRLQQLRWAGEMAIPFTTGLLLGIGESPQDRTATLRAIADLQAEYGHIQEVILQPHSPGQSQPLDLPLFPTQELPALVAEARQILPPEVTLQIPPNLIAQDELLLACLQAGARDLGGIGPWDEVNPSYGHRSLQHLRRLLATKGWSLVPRLPVYGPSLGEAVNNTVVAATSAKMGMLGQI
jgi:FO synthase subunit 1